MASVLLKALPQTPLAHGMDFIPNARWNFAFENLKKIKHAQDCCQNKDRTVETAMGNL